MKLRFKLVESFDVLDEEIVSQREKDEIRLVVNSLMSGNDSLPSWFLRTHAKDNSSFSNFINNRSNEQLIPILIEIGFDVETQDNGGFLIKKRQ